MGKRYQIQHYFKKWVYAESFNTLLLATRFAMRVMKANKNMKEIKIHDTKTGKTKFSMDRDDN